MRSRLHSAVTTPRATRRGAACVLAASLTALIALVGGSPATADVQTELSQTQAKIAENKAKAGVLSTTIEKLSGQVHGLTQRVATLRNREAAVQDQLARKEAELKTAQAELKRAKIRLRILKARLKRSIRVLEQRLVSIYESGTPDVLTVILQADGFSDLVERTEYLNRIQNGDSALVGRVRDLRDQTRVAVDNLTALEKRIHDARDQIAAQRAALARTRSSLQSQESALSAARSAKQSTLGSIQEETERLEDHEVELEGRVRAQLSASPGSVLPAGPIKGAGGGFIWPVNGPVVSGFGMRWGRLHAGIDIAVPSGTPVRASKGGVVAIASPYGGYGNYVCIGHGGGLSTCYAHLMSFSTSAGAQVRQGQVIGITDCTGHCFGPHVHFEVRVNGVPQDPMGYL
jgi:murein DD-endopeptidase MepM/ murein hydrolase activator NlpD